MKPSEILEAALIKLDHGKCWVKGSEARDAEGLSVEPTSQYARSWCLSGVLVQVAPNFDDHIVTIHIVWQVLRKSYDASLIAYFNDHPDTTFTDVEKVLRAAIDLSLSQGQ